MDYTYYGECEVCGEERGLRYDFICPACYRKRKRKREEGNHD